MGWASRLSGRTMGFFGDIYIGLTVATRHMTLPFYEDRHWFPKHMTRTEYFKVRSSIARSELLYVFAPYIIIKI